MVFFNCNACGESMKKNQVDKHCQHCRGCQVVSCVDCGKEYWGDDYKEHVKCISEEEKYSGKNYKPKANANKGEKKQEQWVDQVQSAIEKSLSGSPKLTSTLKLLLDYPNIPRKKAKFENFMKNSMRVRETYLITQCWDAINAEISKKQTESQDKYNETSTAAEKGTETPVDKSSKQNGDSSKKDKRERKKERQLKSNKTEKKDKKRNLEYSAEKDTPCDNEEDDVQNSKKKKKKSKKDKNNAKNKSAEEEEPSTIILNDTLNVSVSSKKVKLETTIEEVLQKRGEDGLSVKKLRKKVLRQFQTCGGDGKGTTEEKLSAKFMKKINSNPKFKVHKEIVTLVYT